MSWPHVLVIGVAAATVVTAVRCGGTPERQVVGLPAPNLKGALSLEEAIARRRSSRSFADRPLTLDQLGQLAWAGQGITDARRGFRSAPSAGALYPLELYFVTPEATYHYRPAGHQFAVHRRGDQRAALAEAALRQAWVRTAAVGVVIAAVHARTSGKYGARGQMYVHMEAGHVAQNLLLQATALGLAHVPVGAFRDREVTEALALPADHAPLYIICIGHGPGRSSSRPGS